MQVVSSTSQSEPLDWFERNLAYRNEVRQRSRKKVIFLTADQIEEQADAAASEAKQLRRRGETECAAYAAQLRVYATMKARSHHKPPIEIVADPEEFAPA